MPNIPLAVPDPGEIDGVLLRAKNELLRNEHAHSRAVAEYQEGLVRRYMEELDQYLVQRRVHVPEWVESATSASAPSLLRVTGGDRGSTAAARRAANGSPAFSGLSAGSHVDNAVAHAGGRHARASSPYLSVGSSLFTPASGAGRGSGVSYGASSLSGRGGGSLVGEARSADRARGGGGGGGGQGGGRHSPPSPTLAPPTASAAAAASLLRTRTQSPSALAAASSPSDSSAARGVPRAGLARSSCRASHEDFGPYLNSVTDLSVFSDPAAPTSQGLPLPLAIPSAFLEGALVEAGNDVASMADTESSRRRPAPHIQPPAPPPTASYPHPPTQQQQQQQQQLLYPAGVAPTYAAEVYTPYTWGVAQTGRVTASAAHTPGQSPRHPHAHPHAPSLPQPAPAPAPPSNIPAARATAAGSLDAHPKPAAAATAGGGAATVGFHLPHVLTLPSPDSTVLMPPPSLWTSQEGGTSRSGGDGPVVPTITPAAGATRDAPTPGAGRGRGGGGGDGHGIPWAAGLVRGGKGKGEEPGWHPRPPTPIPHGSPPPATAIAAATAAVGEEGRAGAVAGLTPAELRRCALIARLRAVAGTPVRGMAAAASRDANDHRNGPAPCLARTTTATTMATTTTTTTTARSLFAHADSEDGAGPVVGVCTPLPSPGVGGTPTRDSLSLSSTPARRQRRLPSPSEPTVAPANMSLDSSHGTPIGGEGQAARRPRTRWGTSPQLASLPQPQPPVVSLQARAAGAGAGVRPLSAAAPLWQRPEMVYGGGPVPVAQAGAREAAMTSPATARKLELVRRLQMVCRPHSA